MTVTPARADGCAKARAINDKQNEKEGDDAIQNLDVGCVIAGGGTLEP